LTDNVAMAAVRDGCLEKLAILFERYHVQLFNYFLRMTRDRGASEDLVQEVFARIIKYRSSYQEGREFKVWMYRIAANVHIDSLRKTSDTVPLDEVMEETTPGPQVDLVGKIQGDREVALLNRAIGELSVKRKEILILSRFHEMKCGEIAELLGCSPGTVRVLLHRTIRELGQIYARLSREAYCRGV